MNIDDLCSCVNFVMVPMLWGNLVEVLEFDVSTLESATSPIIREMRETHITHHQRNERNTYVKDAIYD
jgi:hypothetical protein